MKKYRQLDDIIGYEIFIRSFSDSNNDGCGDLIGIKNKLDYLSALGINLIWITPFNKSGQKDSGYDISDYYAIEKCYGNMADLEALINEAHQRGIRIIMDLVMNHTSDQHPWFLSSINQSDNKADFYIWRKEINNWASFLGESVWTYNEKRAAYYLHIFTKHQPDLNYQNPLVKQEMLNVAQFYLKLGIDGFRLDAIAHLIKDWNYASSTLSNELVLDTAMFSNREGLVDILRDLKVLCERYNALLVGEVGGEVSLETSLKYLDKATGIMDLAFTFDHCWLNGLYGKVILNEADDKHKLNTKEFIKAYSKFYEGFKGSVMPTIYWLNHDHPRLINHYGSIDYKEDSSKALACCLYLLYGVPFIYNGEEIGMTNPQYDSIMAYSDEESIMFYNNTNYTKAEKLYHLGRVSRDNARNMMDWENPNLEIFNFYQQLLRIRREYRSFINQCNVEFLDLATDILGYYRKNERDKMLILVNVSDKTIYLKAEKLGLQGPSKLLLGEALVKNGGHYILKPYFHHVGIVTSVE